MDPRTALAATRTLYVRTNGSDSNDGLANTADGAFLTLQAAVNRAMNDIDTHGYAVTIQLADGTYTAGAVVQGRMGGGGYAGDAYPLKIIGNETTPANVIISTTSANAITARSGAHVFLAGMKLQTTTGGYGLSVDSFSFIEHRNLNFGAIAQDMILTQGSAVVRAIGPTTVSGNASSFCHAVRGSLISFGDQTLTFSGSPVFSTYLWGLNKAIIDLNNTTIVGTATGGTTVHIGALLDAGLASGTYLGGSAPQVDDGGQIITSALITNRTFYVRPGGSDANDGLVNTDARAFATIQGAIVSIAKRAYNPRTWGSYHPYSDNCTIQIANGTYDETVYLYDLPGYMGCTLKGDETTPGNVVINGAADGLIAIGNHKVWALKGVKLTAASGSCIRAAQGSVITYQNVDFGSASAYHIQVDDGARVIKTGNYSISGGAACHIRSRGGQVNIDGVTITLTGTPNFSNAFIYLEDMGMVRVPSATFTGSATGKRYDIRTLSCINTNTGSGTYLPGDSAGSSASGAQYT